MSVSLPNPHLKKEPIPLGSTKYLTKYHFYGIFLCSFLTTTIGRIDMNIENHDKIAEKHGVSLEKGRFSQKGSVSLSVWREGKFLGTVTSASSGGFLADELERKILVLLRRR